MIVIAPAETSLTTIVFSTNALIFASLLSTAIALNVYEPVVGATVVTTQSKPGKGNPYIVRDREQDALGYKGITFRTTWPIIKPELNVNLAKSYDTLVTEYTVNYQSPDNQYVKGTDLTAEVYIDNSATAGSKASDLNTAISTTWFA